MGAAITGSSRHPLPLALLRVTLGVIFLVTWVDNLDKGLYGADGYEGFLEFLFAADGNDSSLSAYKSLLDGTVLQAPALAAGVQLVVELVLAVGLITGTFTRLLSLVAAAFFFSLVLAYFGGEEWIWTYVLLLVSSIAVFLGWGGRAYGVDVWLARTRGESPYRLLW